MKRRIEQLLNGEFEYEVAPLRFSPERIEESAGMDQVCPGFFETATADERKTRCFVYSSNPRVLVEPQTFYAATSRVKYQVNLKGLERRDRVEGVFTICSDRGEYELPYCFTVLGPTEKEPLPDEYVSSDALCEMAQEDFRRAYALMETETFENGLKEHEPGSWLIYDALRTQEGLRRLEEYLTGTGEKEPVGISLENGGTALSRPERSVRQSFVIHKDNWGYQELTISSDERFLRPEKQNITTEDFVGDRFLLDFVIDTNFLHAGSNFGRITISSCFQTLYYEVTVNAPGKGEKVRSDRIQKMMRRKLLSLYLDMRLRKIEMQVWVERSMNVISSYRRAGGTDLFADLFQAQLWYAGGKKTRAKNLLKELEKTPSRFKTPEQYAFYLYLTTFFEHESSYVDQVEARILQLFLSNRKSWIIQWILLYLQEKYLKDDQARLQAVMNQVQEGCSSPIMYLEAAQILLRDPYALRELTGPWCRVLGFALRYGLVSDQLIYQIAGIARHQEQYSPMMRRLLEGCYKITRSPEIVEAMCTILVAGNCKSKEDFVWYERGVALECRINGLYEYYMETMDESLGIEKMPQVIRMYFSYSNTLNYHKKAAIYRAISDNRDNVPQVYRSSRADIEDFVASSLSMERIDENLAVLYERFITRKMLTREMAEHLAKLLFTFKISCKNPKMKAVRIVYPNLKNAQELPMSGSSVKVPIYSADARILLLDEDGNIYASSALYQAERYLESPLLFTYCRELAPNHPGLVLFICSQLDKVNEDNVSYVRQAEQMVELTGDFRRKLRRYLLDYYRRNPSGEDVYEYLRSLNLAEFMKADKTAAMELMAQEGMYEEAFELIRRFGAENIKPSALVRICSQMVLNLEYEEDADLVRYCADCFRFGKYNDHVLTYLLMYYEGPLESMKRLWTTGRAYELDTMALEEKILSMILFCRSGSEGTEQIFISYQRKLGRKKICRAYANLKSYEYFVRNLPVNDLIFEYIEQAVRNGTHMEDVCLLALLYYYSRKSELDEREKELAAKLLAQYDKRNMRFAFYQLFPKELRLPLQIDDRVFLEYVANPAHKVILHYRLGKNTNFESEVMRDVFEGIFVREFILFEGEELECYMEELVDDEVISSSAPRVLTCENASGAGESRFGLLCAMQTAKNEKDEEKLREELDHYCQMDFLTREIFTLV